MKKLLLFFSFFILHFTFCIAQNNPVPCPTDKDYKWGVGVQVSNPTKEVKVMWFDDGNESYDMYNTKDKSFSLGLSGKYTFNNGLGIHLKAEITKIDIIRTGDYWSFSEKCEEKIEGTQNQFHLTPGITWNTQKRKLNYYVGFEIISTFLEQFYINFNYTILDTTSNIYIIGQDEVVIPKGFSIGAGAVAGFDFYFFKNLSIGAEFSPSIVYYKSKGETITKLTNTSTVTQTLISSFQTVDEKNFFLKNKFSFNIKFSF